jgi:alanine dehydrogenase
VTEADLHRGLHLTMLGADGPGKAEATVGVVSRCALFCDDWVQASHGGEITLAVEQGRVTQDDVTALGAVLTGDHAGRTSDEQITLFDSTGLAIQDLAIARAAWHAWTAGAIDAQTVTL